MKIINNHDNDIKREGSAMSEWRNDVTCPLTRLPRPLWHADDGFLLSVKHFLPEFAGQQLSHYLAKLLWPLSHACGSFSLIPIFISGFKIWGKINRFLHKICSCFHFMKKYMLRMVKYAIINAAFVFSLQPVPSRCNDMISSRSSYKLQSANNCICPYTHLPQ